MRGYHGCVIFVINYSSHPVNFSSPTVIDPSFHLKLFHDLIYPNEPCFGVIIRNLCTPQTSQANNQAKRWYGDGLRTMASNPTSTNVGT